MLDRLWLGPAIEKCNRVDLYSPWFLKPVEDVDAKTRRHLIADGEHLYHRFVYLARVGNQNLPVADLASAHVMSTVTLSIAKYTYAYEYPVKLHTSYTHIWQLFFQKWDGPFNAGRVTTESVLSFAIVNQNDSQPYFEGRSGDQLHCSMYHQGQDPLCVGDVRVRRVRLSSAACLPKIGFCACAGTPPA